LQNTHLTHPPYSTERRDRDGVDFASFEVMDGLQRISTIIYSYAAKYELDGL
jgi:hypothetical protein